MKYIFVSDIHGSVEGLKRILEIFEEENADKLVILGDTSAIMNHKTNIEIAELLNNIKEKLEIVRGNCDSDSFEEMLNIKMLDVENLYINSKFVTITHGNHYNYIELPPNCGEIFVQGHTHIPILKEENGRICANPGSITKPRGVDLRCYLILDEEKITLKTLDGKILKEIKL